MLEGTELAEAQGPAEVQAKRQADEEDEDEHNPDWLTV